MIRIRCLLLFALVGCSSSGPACYPVRGQVLYRGQPAREATVVFHSVNSPAPSTTQPFAITDSDGRFAITTVQPKDGARPGEYSVTVTLRALVQRGEEAVREGKHLLPIRYAMPKTSGLRATVQAGENELTPWHLKD